MLCCNALKVVLYAGCRCTGQRQCCSEANTHTHTKVLLDGRLTSFLNCGIEKTVVDVCRIELVCCWRRQTHIQKAPREAWSVQISFMTSNDKANSPGAICLFKHGLAMCQNHTVVAVFWCGPVILAVLACQSDQTKITELRRWSTCHTKGVIQ